MRRAPQAKRRTPLRLGAAPRSKRRTPLRLGAVPLRHKMAELDSSSFCSFFEYFRYILSILSEYYSVFWCILVHLQAITLFPLNGISVLVFPWILYVFLHFYVFLCEIMFLLLHA